MNKQEIEKYSRQIIIKNIGILGQKKILKGNVLVVGAGGLGCPVIDLLTRSGLGKIGIVDKDKVKLSNIHRQNLFNLQDINKFKVDIIKKKISKINPKTKIEIFKEFLNENNAEKIIRSYDIIVDGSDNFKTKFLINRFCFKFKKKLITGAISKFEGHIFTFDFKKSSTPCLKCFYQDVPSDEILNCEFDGVVGYIATLIGSIQSNEVIKFLLNIGNNLNGKILIINLLTLKFRSVKFNKKKKCDCN